MSIVHIPFYPSDWLAGTAALSDAEKGVYITLVARMYEMAGTENPIKTMGAVMRTHPPSICPSNANQNQSHIKRLLA